METPLKLQEEKRAVKEYIYTVVCYDMKIWTDFSLDSGSQLFSWIYDANRMFLLDRVCYLTKAYNLDHSKFLIELNTNHITY